MELESTSLLDMLPTEIQALIYSSVTIADITSISLTCHNYHLNVWACVVALGPAALQNMVAQAADIASSAYIDDLFSEPDPRLVEVSKVQQLPIFHKIFERVNRTRFKLDKFVLHAADGFDDIKEDFFSAVEKYPSFIQQITSLTVLDAKPTDLRRFMKITPHVQHLDWHLEGHHVNPDVRGPLTSLVLRQCKDLALQLMEYWLLNLPCLVSLEFIDCDFWLRSGLYFSEKNNALQRLSFLNCNFRASNALVSTAVIMLGDIIRPLMPELKVLDLRGTVALPHHNNISPLKQDFPNLEIILGVYDKPNLRSRTGFVPLTFEHE